MIDSAGSVQKQVNRRWGALKQERSSWIDHWSEISRYVLPRTGRFLINETNRGDRRHNAIYDSTATRALRIHTAGLMAGMTSMANPWFRLTTSVAELDESVAVKQWLADVTRLMQMIFAKSNTYRALHSMYEELGAFGTAASVVMPDYDNVIHHYTLTAGEYAIATDQRGIVDTLYREYQMSVAQMVQMFGYESVSRAVQQLYSRGSYDAWATVTHAIEPRRDGDASKLDSRNMRWRSVWVESGADDDRILRESGFKTFRALCPRWATSGGDIYGNSPGMEALGDIKQLQHEQLRKSEAIDYKLRPPLQVPTQTRNLHMLPGGVTYVDSVGPGSGIRSAYDVNLDIAPLLLDIQDVRERIKACFNTDMFLMIDGQSGQMTATEVAERHQEKLLMLGPVLERLQNEILDPLIEITFAQMIEAGIVPRPPDELQGKELNVEFISMLAQAQRAVSTNSVDRFVISLGQIAGMKPDVLDKLDTDRWADAYADMLGIDPDLIVSSQQVALVRQQRADAQQAQQQAEMMQQQAATAGQLANIDTSKQSALTDIAGALKG